jgi:hypothetical protein
MLYVNNSQFLSADLLRIIVLALDFKAFHHVHEHHESTRCHFDNNSHPSYNISCNNSLHDHRHDYNKIMIFAICEILYAKYKTTGQTEASLCLRLSERLISELLNRLLQNLVWVYRIKTACDDSSITVLRPKHNLRRKG